MLTLLYFYRCIPVRLRPAFKIFAVLFVVIVFFYTAFIFVSLKGAPHAR